MRKTTSYSQSQSTSHSTSKNTSWKEEKSESTSKSESRGESWNKGTSHTQSHSQNESSSQNQSTSKSENHSESTSTSRKVLDEEMLAAILKGLGGQMTQEQIEKYAQNLLEPVLHAQKEQSRRQAEAARLSGEQEIEELAKALERDVGMQQSAYKTSRADVETDALARGMGRSSYTLQTLANQGDALAKAVQALTEENNRKAEQVRKGIAQAQQQDAQTQARLDADYAKGLAAKVQELNEKQKQQSNSNYLAAISAAMGQQTTTHGVQTGTQQTTGRTQTQGSQTSTGSTVSNQQGGSTQHTSGSTVGTHTGHQVSENSQSSAGDSSKTTETTSSGGGSGSSKKKQPPKKQTPHRGGGGKYNFPTVSLN